MLRWGNGDVNADAVNPVEQAVLPSFPSSWPIGQHSLCQVWVLGRTLPEGPQPFSLVIHGPDLSMLSSCGPAHAEGSLLCGTSLHKQVGGCGKCPRPWVGVTCEHIPLLVGGGKLPDPG